MGAARDTTLAPSMAKSFVILKKLKIKRKVKI